MTDGSTGEKDWVREAVARIEADFQRSADTHLLALTPHGFTGIDLYLKDESSHPTGSLKHRLARSLFLYALCNNWLGPRSTVVEASSGSTAVSEAYFARLIGLPFLAVMPATVSTEKIRSIERQGGRCELVADPMTVYAVSERRAKELGGHYMDQFTYAERATDWRSNNNIAESIFTQMRRERHPVPRWIVCAAGTGGTLATVGRYVRYAGHDTRVCGVDAEHSVFFEHYLCGDRAIRIERASRIEGIGRPRVEASFLSSVLDAMVKVPDVWSVAAMLALSERLGRLVGPSTGTNLLASLACAVHMRERGERGSIVTLLCDSGERYVETYYRAAWRTEAGLACEAEAAKVRALLERGDPCPTLLAQWRLAGELAGRPAARPD
jgi:cysteine synthase A